MEKVLTVTIPAYNAEKYLGTSLDSLCIPEVIEDLDVIVINDGSTDRTAEIAYEYVFRYPSSVRLISKENGGHGSGINQGIKEACGRYFKVIDADDWADKKGLSELIRYLKSAEENEMPDLVSTGFLWAFDNGSSDVSSFNTNAQFEEPFAGVEYEHVYPVDEVIERTHIKFHHLTVRTALLRSFDIKVDEHVYYEDTEYALYPVLYAKTIAFTQGPMYMYRIGNTGQSMSKEKLVKNAAHYDIVFRSLLDAYKVVPVSPEVRRYEENFIARVFAGRIKISLMMPIGRAAFEEIRQLNIGLKKDYPDIYKANINKALEVLRKTGYLVYLPAAWWIRFRGIV